MPRQQRRPRDGTKRKLVIVGDGACGKTSLLSVFTTRQFPQDHFPTVFDNIVSEIMIDGKLIHLALWDTAGQEEYERLRPLSYAKASVILIAFAINQPDSLENVTEKWIEETNQLCPGIPVILVGLKKDLREDPDVIKAMERKGISFVDKRQGDAISRRIGARKYLECSALTGENVDAVFEVATRASLSTREPEDRRRRRYCVIL